MKEYTVKELVINKTARFKYFRDNELWYEIVGTDFIFPVTTDRHEVGSASFNCEEKASLLMRYIRKHLDTIKN